MPLDLRALLTALSAAPGPSGHEAPVAALLRATWASLVDTFESDGLGSLIATRRGSGPEPRPRVMLCAHMDEIALMVAEVRAGFLRAEGVGIDHRVMLQQPVTVHGRRALPGLYGAAPPHMRLERKKYPPLGELWIDVGLPADEVAALVRVGDLVTFDAPALRLKGERLAAKSLDNRASLAALTLCLDELARRQHAWDVVAVASTQEEIGAYGAISAAYQVQPDLAVALDVTYGAQRGVDDDDGFALGGGPTVSRGPNFHPLLVDRFRQTARAEEIKLEVEPLPGDSQTDAWEIQLSRDGVPTLLLAIPVRNMHSPVEVVDLRDVRRAGRLLAAFVAGLPPDFLSALVWPEAAEGGEA